MFVKLSDVDLDATLAKAEFKYDRRRKKVFESSCINAECVCVCVCVCAFAAVRDITGIIIDLYRSCWKKQMCEA